MTHSFEKNIVDIKKEYTKLLINIVTPFLFEGFQSMYEDARVNGQKYLKLSTIDPNIKSVSTIKIFQHFLKEIPKLSSDKIEKETNRIKITCPDYFDNLVKAAIKSYIILLTYNASEKKCKLVEEKYHQQIDTNKFIHKCYIECARIMYSHADLFWHELAENEIKYNQRIVYQLIGIGINKAIMLMLPMKSILEEYLRKDYIEEHKHKHPKIPYNIINDSHSSNCDEKNIFGEVNGDGHIVKQIEINKLDIPMEVKQSGNDDIINERTEVKQINIPIEPSQVNPTNLINPTNPTNPIKTEPVEIKDDIFDNLLDNDKVVKCNFESKRPARGRSSYDVILADAISKLKH